MCRIYVSVRILCSNSKQHNTRANGKTINLNSNYTMPLIHTAFIGVSKQIETKYSTKTENKPLISYIRSYRIHVCYNTEFALKWISL